MQRGKIYLTQKQRDNVAGNQPDRDAAHAQQRVFHTVKYQHNQQHQRRQPQVFHRAERAVRLRAEAAAEIGNTDVYQTQTNQHHDYAADRRRNHFFQIRQKPRRETHQKRADKRYAQERRNHRILSQTALFHPRAERTDRPEAVDLQISADTRRNHRHRHEICRHLHRQFQRAAHNQRGRNHRHKNRQKMGNCTQERITERRPVFQTVHQIRRIRLFFHCFSH